MKISGLLGLALVPLVGVLLATCAQDSQNTSSPGGFASAAATADADAATFDYRIAPRDVLQINVFQVPDLNREVKVNGAGSVVLPLVGNIHVAGKTTDEAQQLIAAKLGKTYLRSPQVTVAVAKSGQRVTINGAVKGPQVLTIDGRLTLAQAIASTGGLSELANAERVHVARVVGPSVQDNVFDVNAIQAGKAPDPTLVGGDIVIVEESNSKVALKTVKDLLPFAIIGSVLSDIRVKRDLVPIGHLANGLRLYRYRYVWGTTRYIGVMAQEVMQVRPDAVSRGGDGYLRVDYQRLGLNLQTWDEWLASRH